MLFYALDLSKRAGERLYEIKVLPTRLATTVSGPLDLAAT